MVRGYNRYEREGSGEKMKSETRYLLENCLKVARGIQLSVLGNDNQMSVYELLRKDLFHFMVYITMSDGKANREEVRYINKYLGYNYTPETLFQGVTDETVFTDSFLSHPPKSLEYFLDIEGIPGLVYHNTYYNAIRMYYETFIRVGRELAKSKGEPDLKELKNIDRYCKMLQSNINRLQKQRYAISDSTTQYLEFGNSDRDINPSSNNRFLSIDLGDYGSSDDKDKKFISLDGDKNTSSSHSEETDTFTGTITTQDQIEPLEELLSQLHGLIGLKSVKVFILSFIISILPIPESTIKTSGKLPA